MNMKKEVDGLKKSLRVSEQYSCSNCIEILGVPESVSENIHSVSRVLGFEFIADTVDAAHRLSCNPAKPSAPRGITVKFSRRLNMEALHTRSRVINEFSAVDFGI